ncbi:MAG: peptide deformylase [Ruminococcaceae bacterium]|nr:peptide deformylase [Oscillospiraceae bacterium]
MALREILTIDKYEEQLRKKSREVTEFDQRLHTLLDDMWDTLYKSGGVGLAAPQVGILKRVVVIDIDDVRYELINPVIKKASGCQKSVEGCLSCPGLSGETKRPNKVTVGAYDRNGNYFEATGKELMAKCFCHEIDHLDGILYLDVCLKNSIVKDNF